MSKFDKITKAISNGNTILGVGPMSWNCVDVIIEVANKYKIPICLIASRRQIEYCGGYVTNTKKLSYYVKQKDVGDFVFLCRDHGGVYQDGNKNFLYETSLDLAKKSFEEDIKNGFDIIHIDSSLASTIANKNSFEDFKNLYEFCENIAEKYNKNIVYEAGTEEHGGNITNSIEFNNFVEKIKKYPKTKFVVGNTGLFVKELENIGKFDKKTTKEMIKICNDNNLYFKGHNTDYVDYSCYQLINEIGTHSINIAPEYGTIETRVLLNLMNKNEKKIFINTAVQSNKWKKWMIHESSNHSNNYLATICGHYIFSEFFKHFPRKYNLWCKIVKTILKDKLCNDLVNLGWELSITPGFQPGA